MLKSVSSITNAIGALNYKGTWNASTNTPTLADGTGAKGDYYVVSTAGTQTFDGILLIFGVGDWIVYNGAVWQRVEGGADGNFVNLSVSGTAVIADNSANAALRITQIGAGNALLVEDSANPDASPFVIDQSGIIGIGTTTPQSTFSLASGIGIQSSSAFAPQVVQRNKTNDTSAPYFISQKDRAGAIVQSGDAIGNLIFQAYDGASYINSAIISAAVDGTPGTNDMPGRLVFSTTADGASSPTERMRIDSAGNVGIGTTAQAFEKFVLAGTFPSGSANTRANVVRGTIPSSTTGLFNGFRTEPGTQAASFTLAALTHFNANQGTFGASSVVTNQYGFLTDASLIGATNNYGFYSSIASGTGRWNFYAADTAANYFAGNVGIGTTSVNNGYGAGANLNLANASTITFNNASNVWNTSTAGGAITYFTDNSLYIDAKDSTSTIKFRVNGANIRGEISSAGVWSLGAAPGSESLRVTPVASAVNYVDVSGAVTVGAPSISAAGSDTNIGFALKSKGTGGVNLVSNNQQIFAAANVNGSDFTNYYTTSGFLNYTAAGSSTNINFYFGTKGTGSIQLATGGGEQFRVSNTASAVNYLQVTGGATGVAPAMSTVGTDTNIDLALTPKGTGVLRFGTHTAGILSQSGYITVKDSAGNTRNLLVG